MSHDGQYIVWSNDELLQLITDYEQSFGHIRQVLEQRLLEVASDLAVEYIVEQYDKIAPSANSDEDFVIAISGAPKRVYSGVVHDKVCQLLDTKDNARRSSACISSAMILFRFHRTTKRSTA